MFKWLRKWLATRHKKPELSALELLILEELETRWRAGQKVERTFLRMHPVLGRNLKGYTSDTVGDYYASPFGLVAIIWDRAAIPFRVEDDI